MSIVENVADYVRKQGLDYQVHVDEVASALGLTRPQVVSARADATRKYDDIYPCAPSMMVFEPGWKESHPEAWEAALERTRAISAGKARAKGPGPAKVKAPRTIGRPNIIGPVIMIHNVVGVNVYPDHIAIQHDDGSWTEFTGTVKLKTGGK